MFYASSEMDTPHPIPSLGQTHICFEILGLALDGVQIEPNVDFYCVGKGIVSHVQTTSSSIFGSSADPTES